MTEKLLTGTLSLNTNKQTNCILNFNKQKTNIFKRHIWLFDQGDYQALSNELRNTNWESFKDADINKYANNITEHIIKSSTKHIPNKVVNVRPSDLNWLNTDIKDQDQDS